MQNLVDLYLDDYRKNKKKQKLEHEGLDLYKLIGEILEDKTLGLLLVSLLTENCETDNEISYAAAGPLEELLYIHAKNLLPELEISVRQSPKMSKAIRGVWASEGSEARETLDYILHKFNLTYGSL